MLKIQHSLSIILLLSLLTTNSYAQTPVKNQSQDEIIEKAKAEALKKTQSSKYHQHDKKSSPDETASQISVKHGGPAAVITTTNVKKLDSQNEIIEKARLEAIKKSQSSKYHQHDKKSNPDETASQIHKKHYGEEKTGS